MPLKTSEVLQLSGATETDIKNWRRRDIAEDLPASERGRVTDWDKIETLQVCYLKALVDSGLPAHQAAIEARRWCLDESARPRKKLARFYARNARTGESIEFSDPEKMTVHDLVTALSDEIDSGWAGEPKMSEFQSASGVVVIDRGEIRRRVNSAFGE